MGEVQRCWSIYKSYYPEIYVAQLGAVNSFRDIKKYHWKNAESSWVAVRKGKEGLNKFNEPQSGIFARNVANQRYQMEKNRWFLDCSVPIINMPANKLIE